MNPINGGKWAESVWCNWCQQHMGGPLAICPKCGNKQQEKTDYFCGMCGCKPCSCPDLPMPTNQATQLQDHISGCGKDIKPSDYDREFWGDGQQGECELGCTDTCKANEHGCASECPALPWQPAQPVVPQGDRCARCSHVIDKVTVPSFPSRQPHIYAGTFGD